MTKSKGDRESDEINPRPIDILEFRYPLVYNIRIYNENSAYNAEIFYETPEEPTVTKSKGDRE